MSASLPHRPSSTAAGGCDEIQGGPRHGATQLQHRPPADYAEFLAQRMEVNYFAAAVLVPQQQYTDPEKRTDASWPSARVHSALLTTLPAGAFPNVDISEVRQFLERQDGRCSGPRSGPELRFPPAGHFSTLPGRTQNLDPARWSLLQPARVGAVGAVSSR